MAAYNSIFVLNGKAAVAVETSKEALVSELVKHFSPVWAEKKAAAEASGEDFALKDELANTLDMLQIPKKVLNEISVVSFSV